MKIKLTKEQIELLSIGSRIVTSEGDYSNLPYWFKKRNDGFFDAFLFDKLQEDLITAIKNERNNYE